MSISVREAMLLDSAVAVCRRIAERDLGTNVGNMQSIRHVVNEFMKVVESRKMTFKHWWNISDAFDKWIWEIISFIVTDEEILREAYNRGDLKELPHSTPTTDREKGTCQTWKNNIPYYIRQVFDECGIGLDKLFKIG